MAKQEDFAPKQAQGFMASEVHLTQTKEVSNVKIKNKKNYKLVY